MGVKRRWTVGLVIGVSLSLVVIGCDGDFLGLGGDGEAVFRADRSLYTLQPTELGLEVSIPFTYQNRTGRRIHFLNCNGFAPPHLEKRVQDAWVFAWATATPDCISPPIPIPYLATYSDEVPVFHGAGEVHPKFETEPLDGTYRLVWDAVRWNNDGSLYSIGDTLPKRLRVSDPFRIEAP